MGADITDFGVTSVGHPVARIRIGAGDLSVALLTFGAVLQDVRLRGVEYGLTLGSDRLADYEGTMHYHGALVGPVANRLTAAAAVIAGTPHRFEANEAAGSTLHSGRSGTHARVWTLAEASDDQATLRLHLPDGTGGFPGNRTVTAEFRVSPPATLRLTVTTLSDAPTLVNFANHSYWNLDGTPTWTGHRLQIDAGAMLPVDADLLPTGEVRDVAGTEYDFRTTRSLHPRAPALDTCFCLSRGRGPLRDVVWLEGTTGVRMVIASTEPAFQIYDGRLPRLPGMDGYEGMALETQGWIDAPNQPEFPGIEVAAGVETVQITEWRFAKD